MTPDSFIRLDDLATEEEEHGALIPVELAPDDDSLMRLAREALGHHVNLKRGPYMYVLEDGGYRRIAPHLSFQHPDAFTAYHVA